MKEYLDEKFGKGQRINKIIEQTGIAFLSFINSKGKLAGQYYIVKDGKVAD